MPRGRGVMVAFLLPLGALAGVELRATCTAKDTYDCGAQVGTQMAAVIQKALRGDAGLQALSRWATGDDPRGRGAYTRLLQLHNATYPHLVQEVAGLAQGAGLPFELMFVNNVRAELSAYNQSAWLGRAASCTDYHGPDSRVWGHNEDGGRGDVAASYLVTAVVGASAYRAFTYAGCLSGWAWGYNRFVAHSVNALTPAAAGLGLGINFVVRDLLDATSADDAVRRASRPGLGGAAHFNLADLAGGPALSLEFAPSAAGEPAARALVSAQRLTGPWYAHTNQFLRLDQPPLGDVESSYRRLARCATLALSPKPPADAAGLQAVLADRRDADYPIYRGSPHDGAVTITSTIFDMPNRLIRVFDRRALPDAAPVLVIHLATDPLALLPNRTSARPRVAEGPPPEASKATASSAMV